MKNTTDKEIMIMIWIRDYIYSLRDAGFDIPEMKRVELEHFVKNIAETAKKEEADRWLNQSANEHDKRIREDENKRLKREAIRYKEKGFELETFIYSGFLPTVEEVI